MRPRRANALALTLPNRERVCGDRLMTSEVEQAEGAQDDLDLVQLMNQIPKDAESANATRSRTGLPSFTGN